MYLFVLIILYLHTIKDFSKLTEMAECADGKSADTWIEDLWTRPAAADDDSMYTAARGKNMMLFPFGKGVSVKAGTLIFLTLQ